MPTGGAAAHPRLARRVLYATAEESMERHIGIGVSRLHAVWIVDSGNTAIRAVTLP